jgi:enterochelin esterase-like enzyme
VLASRRTVLSGMAGIVGLTALGSCAVERHVVGSAGSGSGPQGPGPVVTGVLHSRARNRPVDWTISYPPGHAAGDRLPLVLALHGYMGSQRSPMGSTTPSQLLALRRSGHAMPAVAVAAADGGGGYWHDHPGDNPMAMLLEEFLPLCRRHGLGRDGHFGVIGTSMGGYGALLLAEEHPHLAVAVGAVSPAIWETYDESQAANPTAFTSPQDFAEHDVITHCGRLAHTPVHIASGAQDPFHPWVEVLAGQLPADATVQFPKGAHTNAFFVAHAPEALRFAGHHLLAATAS